MKKEKCDDHVIGLGYYHYDSAHYIKQSETEESKKGFDSIDIFCFCPNCGEKLNNNGKKV